MNNFTQRLLTGVAFVGVMLGSILWNLETFVLMIFFVNAACVFEFFKLFYQSPFKINAYLGAFLATTSLASSFFWEQNLFFPILAIGIAYYVLRKESKVFTRVGILIGGLMFFVIPFDILLNKGILKHSGFEHSPWDFVLPLIVMVWSNDTFAYVGGKLIGKHKLLPKVSPNKTIEGFISGILFTILASYLTNHYFFGSVNKIEYPLVFHVIIGISVGTAATVGDLIQSAAKRKAGVKDSGRLLPGHGGIWDRFDGLILAIPAYSAVQSLFLILNT